MYNIIYKICNVPSLKSHRFGKIRFVVSFLKRFDITSDCSRLINWVK